MCGRFNLRTNARDFADFFRAVPEPAHAPLLFRYNIAPTQDVLAVRSSDGEREAVALRWGLIPSWADDPKIGNRMINARAEGVADKPAFRSPFKRKRCLIPVSGFYEWQARDDGKQPFHIHPHDNRLMAFAGLWDHWQPAEGDPIDSCTILTTAANQTLSELHHRMPVILPPEQYDLWLSEEADRPALERLLQAAPEDLLDSEPVSRAVNNVRNRGPECLEPEKVQQRLL